MKQERFFILAFYRHFVMTCGARQMAANLGHGCHPREAQAEATRSGSRSIRPTARDMAFNTSQTTALTVAAAACNSNGPPTAGSPGRRRSIFLTGLYMERSTWPPTATFLSVEKAAPFTAFAPAMRKSGTRRQLLTR